MAACLPSNARYASRWLSRLRIRAGRRLHRGCGTCPPALHFENVIAFDMCGTTAKCALVEDGRFTDFDSLYHVGGFTTGFRCAAAMSSRSF